MIILRHTLMCLFLLKSDFLNSTESTAWDSGSTLVSLALKTFPPAVVIRRTYQLQLCIPLVLDFILHTHTLSVSLSLILFHYSLIKDIEYSSLCYIVNPSCLSSLYMVVCICQSHIPIYPVLDFTPASIISLFSDQWHSENSLHFLPLLLCHACLLIIILFWLVLHFSSYHRVEVFLITGLRV